MSASPVAGAAAFCALEPQLSVEEYLRRILTARVYEVAEETPLERAPRLSGRLGSEIWFKREDLQPVFSFKLRGAYNKLSRLPPDALARGVCASSAGNHAQGVALAARSLGARAVIVMPETTPQIKLDAVRSLGGEVVLHGEAFDDAQAHAAELAAQERLSFVHPFDDPDVIAGQGTVAVEILRQHPGEPDAIFVPVGGGGLIAGVACYVKSLFPGVRIIGVEPEEAASMQRALSAGHPVSLPRVSVFADGVAVRRVGDETLRLARQLVDEIVLVETDEICAAIRDVFEDTRAIVEPAGALAVAGVKRYLREHAPGGSYVTINSGANMNFDRLGHVVERADIGERKEALLAVEIPERPGSFRQFCEVIGKRHITEFNYRYADSERAHVFAGVELRQGSVEKHDIIRQLAQRGYPVSDLSDNEMAKLHVRHMVGGLARGIRDERLFRFQFPERRGALMDFLLAIGDRWNISLFHYRNHGSDHGRVLCGIQVPQADTESFRRHVDRLGYACWEESDNLAYQLFLAR